MKRYDLEITIKEIDTSKIHDGIKKETVHLTDLAHSEALVITQSIQYVKQTQYAQRSCGE